MIASGYGVNWIGRQLNFERTGQFGDSFGGLSALMAGLAAAFSYAAYTATRDENTRLRLRDVDRDIAERDRDAELSFFRLCEFRNGLVRDIAIDDEQQNLHVRGTDALDEIAIFMRQNIRSSSDPFLGYRYAYRPHRNDLGHYLRFTYHIVRTVIDLFEDDGMRYEYLRLLRAQWSNSEQVLIALNCIYGEGREKFKILVERYSLLHNIDMDDRNSLKLDDLFAPSAFGRAPADEQESGQVPSSHSVPA